MKTVILFIVGSIVAGNTSHAHSTPTGLLTCSCAILADSVGTEVKNGKRYILHRVDQGQTLYAIARRYGRSVAAIQAANPGMSSTVRYDQVVRIPATDKAKPVEAAARKPDKAPKSEPTTPPKADQPAPSSPAKTATQPSARQSNNEARKSDDPARAGIHIVEPRQTLYSLAMQYGVSQTDLRKWNNLPSNNVLIGQALIVSEKAYLDRLPATAMPPKPADTPVAKPTATKPAETKPTDTKPAEPKTIAGRTDAKTDKVTPKRPADAPDNRTTATTKPVDPAVPVESPRPGNDAPMPTYGRRIVVSGVAEMIDGVDGSGKYLALHRTAPIGTLVQVRNAFNSQSLWVKVIGRLPNTGVNDKILIKLSSLAFAKLSPEDRRFRAEVSYIVK